MELGRTGYYALDKKTKDYCIHLIASKCSNKTSKPAPKILTLQEYYQNNPSKKPITIDTINS